MDMYNDNWCQCSVCFEMYSNILRPTTFICGHSVCIAHVEGENNLKECPICQYPLESFKEYHISYSLEEAIRVFNALKASTHWNTMIKTKVEKVDKKPKEIVRYDSKYEEELERKENLLDEIYSTSNDYSHKQSPTKLCGHKCHLMLFNTCCICSNRYTRSSRNNQRIHSKRNRDYCSICETRSKN